MCLFRDGNADWDYLRALHRRAARAGSACAHARRRNGRRRSPAARSRRSRPSRAWSARGKRAYFRLGYGFSRSRNGAANMHAASCIAAVTGAWQLEGGGAFHNNGDVFHLNKTLIEGSDLRDPSIRMLDQSRIGADPDRRQRGAAGRPAGHGAADPEHQSGVGRARSGGGQARLCARRPVRLRARAVHDRDREGRRHRAAGHHVRRARRLLSRRAAANTFCSGRS